MSSIAAVTDCCNRLHLAVDHRDWRGLAAVLADRVAMPALAEAAEGPVWRSRAAVVELYRRLACGATSQHVVGSHVVVVDGDREGDRARCVAQSTTTWVFDGGDRVTRGNEYRYALVLTPSGWRIDGRWTRPVWAEGSDPRDVAAIQAAWTSEFPGTPGP